MPSAPPPTLTQEEIAELPDPKDPLAPEVERQRRELAETQARLLEELKEWQKLRQDSTLTAEELARLTAHTREIETEKKNLDEKTRQDSQSVKSAALSLAEIRERGRRVVEEIEELRKLPPAKKMLRYRTPVSHPLQSEELLFECHHGRVSLIDIGGFLDEIQRTMHGEGGGVLRSAGRFSGVTESIGPFRLRYDFQQEADNSRPDFSWQVETIAPERGETEATALAAGSEFRRLIDGLEPAQTAVTLCVYPDSFALYRKLRDYMHERDIVVAGRAIPDGAGISASRHGTLSRGQ